MSDSPDFLQLVNQIIPPPESPLDAGPLEKWPTTVEGVDGVALPDDFQQFCLAYGSGSFEGPDTAPIVRVFNPFARSYRRDIADFQQIAREVGDAPYDIFPQTPGLLIWGVGDNRREYYWLVDGPPDEWQVVFSDPNSRYFQFEANFTAFLFHLLSGNVDFGGGVSRDWFKENQADFYYRVATPFDHQQYPPPHEAVRLGYLEDVKELLANGVDPNTPNHAGRPPIFPAIEYAQGPEIVKALLDAGADPNAIHESVNETPLHLAIQYKHSSITKLLLLAGANPNVADFRGFTPLLVACDRGLVNEAQYLVDHGADVNACLPDGRDGIELARRSEEIRDLLRKAQQDGA